MTSRFTLRSYLDQEQISHSLASDARDGLARIPKDLPPRWFYDKRGSELFESITSLPEYYPTRTERSILKQRAPEVNALSDFVSLVELGSGSSTKTRVLLDAMPSLQHYVPFDVCEEAVHEAGLGLALDYQQLEITGLIGDFKKHLSLIPRWGRQLVAFLGGTIGNFAPQSRLQLLSSIRESMAEGDMFLLGADLVKEQSRLVAAYDDSAGVTAEFNKNVLLVLNEQLGADFAPDSFEHIAVWDASAEWIEMRLRSAVAQVVHIEDLDIDVKFELGEEMRTEISAKFTRARLESELRAAGFELASWWTDENSDFSLSCSVAQ